MRHKKLCLSMLQVEYTSEQHECVLENIAAEPAPLHKPDPSAPSPDPAHACVHCTTLAGLLWH
jgi:hypothetical protein